MGCGAPGCWGIAGDVDAFDPVCCADQASLSTGAVDQDLILIRVQCAFGLAVEAVDGVGQGEAHVKNGGAGSQR
jgi:hypothetical protein